MVTREQMRDGFQLDPNHAHKPIESIRDYKKYRMYVVKNGSNESKEIVFGETTWEDNIESLGLELNTDIPRNVDDRHFSPYDIIEIGDGIIFKNKEDVIFDGMVEDLNPGRYNKKIKCYDFGKLLGQTNITKQFNNVRGDTAINNICKEQNIPVRNVEVMETKITEIYNNQPISDIFKDIIEKENSKYNKSIFMEIRKGKLHVESMSIKITPLKHKPSSNVGAFDPSEVPGNINKSESLSSIKNHVKAIYSKTEDDNTTIEVVAEAKDDESINKYGRRTHNESITKEDLDEAQTIANNKLRELQGIKTSVTIELLGVDTLRSGRKINIKNKTYGLKGNYKVLNCQQTYINSSRKMLLDLEGM